ncbi:DUF6745 domain-containing protein [Streptomyces bobili]|uniref:DUF6745 domain-containing protein n=1 Tax=Streptomyces bobili TaxID=67280 RepID=UPI00382406D9
MLLKDLLKDGGLDDYFYLLPKAVSKQHWHFEWQASFDAVVAQYVFGSLAECDALARLGASMNPSVHGLRLLASSASWWYPLQHIVLLAERPAEIHVDSSGRLHSNEGPALRFRDGFSIYAKSGNLLQKPPFADSE